MCPVLFTRPFCKAEQDLGCPKGMHALWLEKKEKNLLTFSQGSAFRIVLAQEQCLSLPEWCHSQALWARPIPGYLSQRLTVKPSDPPLPAVWSLSREALVIQVSELFMRLHETSQCLPGSGNTDTRFGGRAFREPRDTRARPDYKVLSRWSILKR